MKRRRFLSGAAAGGAGAATGAVLPAPAIAQGRIEWRMVTAWPRNLPGPGTSAAWLADRITAMSQGRLTVKVLAAGELVPATGVFDAVSQGAAEMGRSMPTHWQAKSPGIPLFGSVPFGMTATEHHAWMLQGGGQALYDEMYARFQLKGFLSGNTGGQGLCWSRREIAMIDDFKAMRVRALGLGGEVYRRIGATVVPLAGGQIFQALQGGAIDAAEFIGPWTDIALGLHQAARFYYWPGIQAPAAAEECIVNKSKHDALPQDLKEIIRTACTAAYAHATAEYASRNPAALAEIVSRHGVQLRQAPPDLLLACGNAAGELMAELRESADDLVRRIADSYLGFRAAAVGAARFGDLAVMEARMLPYRFG